MPETGFTGPVSELNRITGAYPGSVRTRFSDRKPQSHGYTPLSPVLHYNPGQGDLMTLTQSWWVQLADAFELCPKTLSKEEYKAAMTRAYKQWQSTAEMIPACLIVEQAGI
jgi:hypothetical protein